MLLYELFVARSLESIIQEIDPGYSGSRSLIQQQQSALSGETESQLAGLQAQAQQSHTDILDGARRRGLGFGGIPISEQVKYDSTQFKPAVANLYANQNNRRMTLDESLNSLYRDQRSNALNLRESEVNREEQQRQFNENLAFQREQMAAQQRAASAAAAAQSSDLSKYFGGAGGDTGEQKAAGPSVAKNAKGGFTFYSAAGKPITAGAYATATGADIRDVLYEIGSQGDRNAANLYNILRQSKSQQQLAGQLNQLAPKYSYIFNGYVPFGGAKPIGGK